MHKRKKKRILHGRIDAFSVFIYITLGLWGLIILYPFYNAILISMVSQYEYLNTPFMLFPKNIDLTAYNVLLQGNRLLVGYRTTLIILLLGVPLNMFLTIGMAYPLSRNRFPGQKMIFYFVVFSMLFSGGLIPLYLVVRNLGLTNNILAIILITGINTFYLILMKNYFSSIPVSLEESAKIDGANDLYILFVIMLPLAKPILATVLLFYTVDRWNEWFYPMIFLRNRNMIPLQMILRNIVFETTSNEIADAAVGYRVQVFSDGIKMAAITLTMTPIMIVYPFVQKYFMKGIMLGSVKG